MPPSETNGKSNHSVEILLFGVPRILVNGKAVHIGRRKAIALIAYLAVTGSAQSRQSVSHFLWPRYDRGFARAELRRILSETRSILSGGLIESDRESISLNERVVRRIDVREFSRLVDTVRAHCPSGELCEECTSHLQSAVAGYCDDFMHGFSLEDSPGFDEWQLFESEALHHHLREGLRRLVSSNRLGGRLLEAIDHARRLVLADPLDESARRMIIELYGQLGDRRAAAQQYRRCVKTLDRELGIGPEPATAELYHSVIRGPLGDGSTATPRRQPAAASQTQGPPEEYLTGMYHLTNSYSRDAIDKARYWFESCVRKKEAAQVGYVGLAACLLSSAIVGARSAREVFPQIKVTARKLAEIAPETSNVYALLGLLSYLREWQWDEAERCFRKAIEKDPHSVPALALHSLLLSSRGRHREAIEAAELAERANPVSLLLRANTAERCFLARDFERAERESLWIIDLNPDFWVAHKVLGWVRLQANRFQESEKEFLYAERAGGAGEPMYYRALLYAKANRTERARELIDALARLNSRGSAFLMSAINYELKDFGKARKFAEVASLQRDLFLALSCTNPLFDSYRTAPSIDSVLRCLTFGIANPSPR